MLSRGTDDLEVVVVGAGAAGIGAAMRLAAARVSFAVLEARGRVGGRAYTIADAPFPLDLGCGWLHSADRNPWTRIAAEAGFTIDRTLPAWSTQSFDLGFSAEDQDAFALASRRFHDRFEAIGPNDADCSAAELLEPDCRFNPLLNAVSSYVNGVELNLVSVQDSNRYAIAAQAAGLPIRLNCPVMLIDHRGKRLAIETALGTVTADAVIVTVPTPLIAAQGIRFRPELTDKTAAASVLPLGLADKLVMTVEAPELLPMDGHLIGNSNKTATGSYHLRPFGRPLIEGFFGGRLARELEAAGPGALFDFAVAELVKLFGSGIRTRLRPLIETGWGRDLLPEDPILTRFPAMRTHVPRSPRLWMEESFLPERRARRTILRRRTAPI
jgi:monoamine oxidase